MVLVVDFVHHKADEGQFPGFHADEFVHHKADEGQFPGSSCRFCPS